MTTAWKDDGYNVVLLHKQTISKDCIVCFNFNCFQFCFYIYREIISKQPSTLCFFTLFNSWDTIQLSYNVNVYRLFLHCLWTIKKHYENNQCESVCCFLWTAKKYLSMSVFNEHEKQGLQKNRCARKNFETNGIRLKMFSCTLVFKTNIYIVLSETMSSMINC